MPRGAGAVVGVLSELGVPIADINAWLNKRDEDQRAVSAGRQKPKYWQASKTEALGE